MQLESSEAKRLGRSFGIEAQDELDILVAFITNLTAVGEQSKIGEESSPGLIQAIDFIEKLPTWLY